MQKLEYNGWYNYETWNFKLWLDNDPETIAYINGLFIDCKRDAYKLSKALEQYAYDGMPLLKKYNSFFKGFYGDLLGASLREINFYQIAESYLEELNEVEERLET